MQKNIEYKRFISELDRKLEKNNKNIIILCIGSNKIIGDSFGPMVGTKLQKMNLNKDIKIMGNMKKPILASNIRSKIKSIKNNPYIIAVDSALCEYSKEGIFITNKKMILGSGINKNILEIGDVSIKGCIGLKNKKETENFKYLNIIDQEKINKLSDIVSKGIYETLKVYM